MDQFLRNPVGRVFEWALFKARHYYVQGALRGIEAVTQPRYAGNRWLLIVEKVA